MLRRPLRVTLGAACGLCLAAGCLLNRPGERPLPPLPPPEQVASLPEAAPDLVLPPPTPYGLIPQRPIARLSSAGQAPVVPAHLTELIGPAFPATFEPLGPPSPPEPPLLSALRPALLQHPAVASEVLQRPHQSDREKLLELLRLTAGVGEKDLAHLRAEDLAMTLEHVRHLHEQLRQRAALRLDRVCFCRKIHGFGQYQPLPADHAFRAGWEGRPGERVQVYAEVRNFSTARREGLYETTLATRLEIHVAGGRRVAVLDLGACSDRCQSPRQDHFLNIQFNVPAGLTPGLYTLWVGIADAGHKAGGAARTSLDFRVCPPG